MHSKNCSKALYKEAYALWFQLHEVLESAKLIYGEKEISFTMKKRTVSVTASARVGTRTDWEEA